MSVLKAIYRRLLAFRPLVHVGQFLVTGEWTPRRVPLLAESLRPADNVLDLGCGSAPLLEHCTPARYVGIDEHEPSLDQARRTHAGPGRDFVLAAVTTTDFSPWRESDVVVLSSVCHHLPGDEVVALVRRILEEVGPERVLVQDAEPTGPLRGLVTAVDDGDHLRPQAELEELLRRAGGDVALRWVYDNPLRSFHQFLYEMRPISSGHAV